MTRAVGAATRDRSATFTQRAKPPQFTINARYHGAATEPDPASEARGCAGRWPTLFRSGRVNYRA